MAVSVFVPLDSALLAGALAFRPHLLRTNTDELIEDRRFAEAIYREAIKTGLTEQVRFEDPEEQTQHTLPMPSRQRPPYR